jgi:hypothetical protein
VSLDFLVLRRTLRSLSLECGGPSATQERPLLYFVKSGDDGTPRVVYRFQRERGLAEIWRPEGWEPHEDFVRRYWTTGFEGDTDEVSEEDAAKAIALIAKRLADRG